jgi:hypothetical protein
MMLQRFAAHSVTSTMIARLKNSSAHFRPMRRRARFATLARFRPDVSLLEDRTLLSAQQTLTALIASTATAATGQLVTFTATISNLSPGGAIPSGGTVTFSDQSGAIGAATVAAGVAEFSTTTLPMGADTITASYGGTTTFAASITGTIVDNAGTGKAGYAGDNGLATAAELNDPFGVVVDSSGDVFIADASNNVVRDVVKATGNIITVAGNGTAGYSGNGGPAMAAELNGPDGLAIDSVGDLFISDKNNNVIREVMKATGDIITVAGNGTAGYSGDLGPAADAELDSPRGIAIDAAGDLFIADGLNNVIREVTEANGEITTVAGNGKAGYSGDGGPAIAAELDTPNDVAVDPAGDLFIADGAEDAVREVIKSGGDIITFAGNGTAGYTGDGGPATDAELNDDDGVGIDSMGDVFIADAGNDVVREVLKATGDIVTVAGNGTAGLTGNGGPAAAAELDGPGRVTVDSACDVFVADSKNNMVREFTAAVTVNVSASTELPTLTALVASTTTVLSGQPITLAASVSDLSSGGTVPTGGLVTFSDQSGVLQSEKLVDGLASFTTSSLAAGNYTFLASYAGTTNFAPSATGMIVTAAGNGTAGNTGDDGPAAAAELNSPSGLAVDSAGDVFIADYADNVVREVVKTSGEIITVAGNGIAGYRGDHGPATSAELDGPRGLAVDSAGDLFIADSNNNVVRKVVKGTGVIITYAGDGTAGFSGDGGPATSAELNSPRGLDLDPAGNLFIADMANNVIREVILATGTIITVAGDGTAGYAGDYGPATSAELNQPTGVVVDSSGDLFIADDDNSVIREVVKATNEIITYAGDGIAGHAGDNGPATAAELNGPVGVALDSMGDLFIADSANDVVREVVKATGDIMTVAGNGNIGYGGDEAAATSAELNDPSRLAVDSAGDVFVADEGNHVVREFTPDLTITVVAALAGNLRIHSEPSSQATVYQPFPTQPVIYVVNQFGSLDTSDNTTVVHVSLFSGDGPLLGGTTAIARHGIVTFRGLYDVSAETISLAFTTDSQLAAISTPIVVSPGQPSRLVVISRASSIVAGAGCSVEVDAENKNGLVNPTFNGPVTLELAPGSNGTLAGNLTANAVAGVAMFSDLVDTTSGSISLKATSSGTSLPSWPTAPIPVYPGPVDQLVVTATFANADVAGTTGSVTITAEDQYHNAAGSGPNQYLGTVDLASTDPTTSGLPANYTFTANDAGSHTFNTVILETAGNQTITATDAVSSTLTDGAGVDVVPGQVHDFVVTTDFPSPDVAGSAANVTVIAEDKYGNVAGSGLDQYEGTVNLQSSDPKTAGLPSNYMFTAFDAGMHTFTNVILETAGNQTITVTDSVSRAVSGGAGVDVVPAPVHRIVVSTDFANQDWAGTVGTVTVTAEDEYGNFAGTGPNQYLRTIDLVSTDRTTAGLPASYTFTQRDAGTHAFTGVSLETPGSQTITGTDSVTSTLTDQTAVSVVPGPVSDFVVTTNLTSPDPAGTPGSVTVTAKDKFGNTVGSGPNQYEGTVNLVSTDPKAAGLAANYTFTASDAGTHTFTNFILESAGSQTITATDSVDGTIAGNAKINVVPAAVQDFVMSISLSSPDPAGTVGTVTVTAEDKYGNVASSGPNQYEGTMNLLSTDPKTAGLPSSYTFSASDGGSHTFTGVSLETAGNQTITATDSITSTLTNSQQITVTPLAPAQLVIVAQPPSTVSAGTGFGFEVAAKDMYGNINTTFTGPVSVILGTNPGGAALSGATQATAVAGFANFSGLALSKVGVGYTLKISSGSITPATTNPVAVTGVAPIVSAEHVIALYKLNKKKMPQGKPIGFEFELQYNSPMAASAALKTNYQVEATTITNGRTGLTMVSFSESYNESNNTVTLTVNDANLFAKGGKINILASTNSGVSSQAGVLLDSKYTTFTIPSGGNGITLG